MQLYSHLVLASKMPTQVSSPDQDSFYLGSIAPDIRYYVKIPRERTHLSQDDISLYEKKYPYLGAFIDGYRLHCLIDEQEAQLFEKIHSTVLGKLMGRRLTPSLLKTAIEFYYFKSNPLMIQFDSESNEMLEDLGITAMALDEFVIDLNDLMANQSIDSAISALSKFGLVGTGSIDRYIAAARKIEGSWWAYPLIYLLVHKSLQNFESELLNEFLSTS